VGIKIEDTLIKEDVDSMLARAFDHEFAARLPNRCSRLVDELSGLDGHTHGDDGVSPGTVYYRWHMSSFAERRG
jgi:hypothetical protein